MKLPRSILAICAALAAAFAVQLALSVVARLTLPTLVELTGRALTITSIAAYLLGTVSTATAAGIVLGYLAPMKPSVHVAAVAVLSPLVGYLVAGPVALPHGWQIVGYGAQLILLEFVALWAFRTQRRPPAHLSTRPA